MRLTNGTIAMVGSAAAAALCFKRQRDARQAAERFAAAALETLLNAIDANDADTGAHVRRVATYADILADAALISERDRRDIERAALFHDVGKIHEALFDIIHDDSKLSPSDRRAIATHPERGAKVLEPLLGFYPELGEAVLSHHEHWDGKGYPRKLKGNRIPLAARLVAIVDTFDAITHRRRYRDGRPVDVACEVILKGRGTQFDPTLVDLFLFPPVFERILAAQRRVSRWRAPIEQRAGGRAETHVPDITFRWRPARRATPERHTPGLVRRKAR